MIFKVLTQEGKTYTDEVNYAVVKNQDGELAILKDHVPIILHINEGYVKFVKEKQEVFVVLEQAILEFNHNELTVLALEAQLGPTLERARHAFIEMQKEKLEETRKENVDFSKLENELRENIKKGKASEL